MLEEETVETFLFSTNALFQRSRPRRCAEGFVCLSFICYFFGGGVILCFYAVVDPWRSSKIIL